jgi:hypothetical protein
VLPAALERNGDRLRLTDAEDPSYTSVDSENPERHKIEHFGNRSICGALVDIRAWPR